MVTLVKSLEQLKLDASNSDWGAWCRHWGRNPLDMHPNDERALLDGCYFDMRAANRVNLFYEKFLCLPKKGGGTKPFVMFDWWFRDAFGPLFGWKRADGRRRFKKGFMTTAKKSAKSTMLAGLPIYMIGYDGEEEAEAYATAVDRDQAEIIYRKTERMVKLNRALKKRFKITSSQKHIYDEKTGSFFDAISSDADSADGKNWHLLLIDEIHRWKNRSFFETLVLGGISREQALLLMITTAGEFLDGIGYVEFCYAKDLIDPNNDICDISRFALICESGNQKDENGSPILDEKGKPIRRDWKDEQGWIEANPSLLEENTETKLQTLREECQEATTNPGKRRNFMRFVCNWWIADTAQTYIAWSDWDACRAPIPTNLTGKACYGGLDLSSTIDITALCLAFPNELGGFDLKWFFWMPEENVLEKEETDKVPYRDWIEEGYIMTTPGRNVEYGYIRKIISGVQLDETGAKMPVNYLQAVTKQHRLIGIGYDRWNASKLVTELSEYDGITMFEVGQGYHGLSEPCKRLRETIVNKKTRHGGNPVADWMIRNALADSDPADNIKLNKKKSPKRIDGIAAAVDAIAAYIKIPGESGAWSGAKGSGMWG